jgi:glucose-1-phosphate cytidylyltransferase
MASTPKVVILAGGRGTRLAEETESKPKPMVEIGDRPILWHIMKLYAARGFTEFALALGYKGHLIKRYFLDEVHLTGDLTIETAKGRAAGSNDWRRC